MAKLGKNEINMCEGRILPKMIKYAIPLIFTNVLQLVFNACDMAVLGKFVDNPETAEIAQAAVGTTGALINLIVGLFVGLSVGTNVLVARSVGENDPERAHRVVGMSVLFSVIIGVILSIVGVIFARTFLSWIIDTENTDIRVLDSATKYVQIYFVGLPLIMLYNFNSAVLRAVGDTVRPLIFLSIGGVVNIGLNIFFVLVLHKDIEGVAVATVASQGLSAILTLILLCKSEGYCKLKRTYIRFYKQDLLEMARIGLPSGMSGCLFSLSNTIVQAAVTTFGETVIAGVAIASQIESFISNANSAIALSTLAFVGQNLGAGNFHRVRRSTRYGLMLVVVLGTSLAMVLTAFQRQFCSFYNSDPEVIDVACSKLMISGVTIFLCGMQEVMNNVVRGLGKSTVSMIISLLGVCVFRIIWIKVIFAYNITCDLLYLLYPVSWIITFVMYVIVYFPLIRYVENNSAPFRLFHRHGHSEKI